MTYITTKEDCQKQIDTNGKVCTRCGGKLTPIETVDNLDRPTFWIGCESCKIFNYGVKPIFFEIAKKMVMERNHTAYSYEKEPDKEKNPEHHRCWTETQIGGTSLQVQEIISLFYSLTDKHINVILTNEKEFDESLKELGELYEEGKDLIIKVLPPEKFGEDYNIERLYDVLKEMRDLAATTMQKLHWKIEN